MTAPRDISETILSSLLTLSGQNKDLFNEAASIATDAQAGRIDLRRMKRHILEQANPALLATVEAAHDFAQTIGFGDQVLSLPHLQRVYALAVRDISLPRQVFSEAACALRQGGESCPALAIKTALDRQEVLFSFH